MTTRNNSALRLAATAIRLTKLDQCDTRAFEDCFEQGNGSEVVAVFMRVYATDSQLRLSVACNERYINIKSWKLTAERIDLPLFA